ISRSCNRAAPSAPSTGMSRVLAKPAIGALASTATATGSFITVLPRQFAWVGAEGVSEPQPPHQDHGVDDAVLLPAPAGGDDALGEAQRRADALEPLAQRDVLHQRNFRKTPGRLEGVAPREDRLVAGGDAGQPRAQAHQPANQDEQR